MRRVTARNVITILLYCIFCMKLAFSTYCCDNCEHMHAHSAQHTADQLNACIRIMCDLVRARHASELAQATSYPNRE